MRREIPLRHTMLRIGLPASVCCLLAIAVSSAQQGPKAPDIIRTARLIIQDSKGRDRIAMGVDGDRPFILLLDDKQRPRMELAIWDTDDVGLRILDSKRRQVVDVGTQANGATQMQLFNHTIKKSLSVGLQPKGASGITLNDPNGATIIGLISRNDDTRALLMSDAKAMPRAELIVNPTGDTTISLINSAGKSKRVKSPPTQ